MIAPAELERRVFKKKYKSLSQKYANELTKKFYDIAKTCRRRCQEFRDAVLIAIEDSGE